MDVRRLCVLVASVVLSACGQGAPREVVMGTGATGGVYYPYGQALVGLLNDDVPSGRFTAVATGASVDNLLRMQKGELDLALTLADTLAEAVAGTGPFAAAGKVDVHSVAVLYTNYTHLMVRRGAGIIGVTGLKGRSVAVGAPGSGTELVADRLMEAAGLNPQTDVTRMPLGLAEALAALKAGAVDAVFLSGGVPTPAVRNALAEADSPIEFVPNGHLLEALVSRYGPNLYRGSDIIVHAYPGVAADVPVIGVSNLLVASGRLEADLVEAITATLYANNETLALVLAEARGLTWPAGPNVAPAPFHPGAAAYYRQHAWR